MAENQPDQNTGPAPERGQRFTAERLNLVIAVCAVLISAASFVATYMQSNASVRQVKAATWPYLQMASGNYDTGSNSKIITLRVENAGVGPAHVKSLVLYYDDEPVQTFWNFAHACCADKNRSPGETLAAYSARSPDAPIITASVDSRILSSRDGVDLFTVKYTASNAEFWDTLDRARFRLSGKACYCSLLGECYETDFRSEPVEVPSCKIPKDPVYNG